MALSSLHLAVWSYDKWKYGNKDEHWVLMVKDRNVGSGKCYDWTKQGRQAGTGRGLLVTENRWTSGADGLPQLKLKEEMGVIRRDMLNMVEWAATSANGGASSRKYVLAVVQLLVNRGLVDAQHLYALRRSYDKVKYDRYKDSMERQEKFQKQFQERTEAQAQAEAAKANIRQPVYDQNAQGLVPPTPARRLYQNSHPEAHWEEQPHQHSPQTYQQRQPAGLPLLADTKHPSHGPGGWAPAETARQTAVRQGNARLMPNSDLYTPRRHSHSPNRVPAHDLQRRPSLNQTWDGPQVHSERGRMQVKAKPLTYQQMYKERHELEMLARQHGKGGKPPARFGKPPRMGGRH